MPSRWHFRDEGRGIVTEYTGAVTAEDIARAGAERGAALDAERLTWLLNDYGAVDEIEVPMQTVVEHARLSLDQSSGLPALTAVAFVVSDRLMHGLTRVWMAHMTDAPVTVSIFEDRIEAEDWLRATTRLALRPD